MKLLNLAGIADMNRAGGSLFSPNSRAWAILREALDTEPQHQRDFIARACGGDTALLAEVVELLDADRHPDPFLDSPPNPACLLDAEAAPAAGDVGPYSLLAELGRGGMGVVYSAQRRGGVAHHHVALKVLKRGMDSDEILARFLREREILAQLRHQHIAQLIDGGIGDGGQAWFAMELIEGEPITKWCDSARLPIDRRVSLFLDVCSAVQHAHSHLVVHRDLKPSNIFVSDGGQVKLLDFGIAKLLDDGVAAGSAERTFSQIRFLTPEFAAPEQLLGGAIGTATDVYQLGLVLFELLCGGRVPRADNGAVTGSIPSLADTLGSRSSADSERIAAARSSNTAALRRALRGDVDRIVHKALEPEIARRYDSVAALADDLRRLLAGLPVRARPDSAGYRLRKFVGRHAAGTTAALLIAIALVVSSVYSARQATLAQIEARRAQAVRSFLLDLFALNEPTKRDGAPLAARELVDLGARRADMALAEDPDTRIELLGVVGGLYQSLGDIAKSAAIQTDRLKAAQAAYAVDDLRVVRAQIALSEVEAQLDQSEHAERLVRAALAQVPDGRSDALVERADGLSSLSKIAGHLGRLDEAIAAETERVALLRRVGPGHEAATAASLSEIGAYEARLGHVAASNAALDEALSMVRTASDAQPAALIATRANLIQVLTDRGRFDDAQAIVDVDLPLVRRIYGDAHPEVAFVLFESGQIERMRGMPQLAIPLYRQALEIYERVLGSNHSTVATMLTSLAQALSQTGDHAQAIASLERARDIYIATLGPNHISTATATSALAKARLASGDFAGAEQGFRDALARFAASPQPDHIYVEAARFGLGSALSSEKQYADAEPLLQQAHDRFAAAFGVGDFRSVDTALAFAQCLAGEGRIDEAERSLSSLRDVLAKTPEKSQVLITKLDATAAALRKTTR